MRNEEALHSLSGKFSQGRYRKDIKNTDITKTKFVYPPKSLEIVILFDLSSNRILIFRLFKINMG